MRDRIFSRRITAADGSCVGYICRNIVYDVFDKKTFKLISTSEYRIKYVVDITTREIIGIYSGKNSSIFDTERNFIGSVGKTEIILPLRIILMVLFLLTAGFYLMLTMQKNTQEAAKNEPISIALMPSADEGSNRGLSTLEVFSRGKRSFRTDPLEIMTLTDEFVPLMRAPIDIIEE